MAGAIWVALRAIKIQRKYISIDIHIVREFMLWVTRSFAASKSYSAEHWWKFLQWSKSCLNHFYGTQANFINCLNCSVVVIDGTRNRSQTLMKLICSTSLFLLLSFESGDGRWNLRKIIIYSIYCLIDLIEFMQKMITFGLQFSFVSLESSLSII